MSESATAWIEKLKIQELCARYTLTLDGHDFKGWAACFTKDGVGPLVQPLWDAYQRFGDVV